MSASSGIRSFLGPISFKRRVIRDGFWVGAGQFFVVIASLVGTRLITEFVGPGVLGPASLLLGMFAFGKSLVSSPILAGEISFYPQLSAQGGVARLRQAVMPMLGAGAVVFTIIALILGLIWCRSTGISFVAVVILCAMMWLDSWRNFESGLISMARRQQLSSWVSALESSVRPMAIVAAAYFWSVTPQAVILGHCVGVLLPLGFILVFTKREGVHHEVPSVDHAAVAELRRRILHFAIPLVPMAILAWIIALSDRYIIEGFKGAESVGVYAATYGLISQGMMVGQTLIGRVVQPIYYKAVADADVALEHRLFRVWLLATAAISAVGVALVLLLRYWIAHFLLAEQYRSGIDLMGWIAGGYALWAVSSVYETRLYAHKQTSRLLIAYGISAAVAVAGPLILVPQFGILGAAMACPIYFAVMAVSEMLLFRPIHAGV